MSSACIIATWTILNHWPDGAAVTTIQHDIINVESIDLIYHSNSMSLMARNFYGVKALQTKFASDVVHNHIKKICTADGTQTGQALL